MFREILWYFRKFKSFSTVIARYSPSNLVCLYLFHYSQKISVSKVLYLCGAMIFLHFKIEWDDELESKDKREKVEKIIIRKWKVKRKEKSRKNNINVISNIIERKKIK